MCDRSDAIRYLITNQFGNKAELTERITLRQYESFLTTGMIYEPAQAPTEINPSVDKQWITTGLAYERARILNLMPGRKFRLKSTPRTRLYNHHNFLIRIFGLIGII